MPADPDPLVRTAAFDFLRREMQVHGEVLPWQVLHNGFEFDGMRVPLVSQQGIFKPAVLREIPLSIRTTAGRPGRPAPYDDHISLDGRTIVYAYRGSDRDHAENRGLRLAMNRQTPLVYLFGVAPGAYAPMFPVYIVGDDPAALRCTVAVDEAAAAATGVSDNLSASVRREYATRDALQRLHQSAFRERVLRAYGSQCSVCTLRHRELLDAAHILPDSHPRGVASVTNGLAMCKLHHAAFDSNILGIRPNLSIEVSAAVLREIDGPMLVHGLQGFHDRPIHVPKRDELRPDPHLVAERYDTFKRAG